MKRSEMVEVIEEVIDDLLLEGAFGKITDPYDPTRDNSIIANIRFGNVEGRILDAIEKAGMLPPNKETVTAKKLVEENPEFFHDDGYHGLVCRSSHWDYLREVPRQFHKYLKVNNCGQYSVVMVKSPDPVYEWEPEDA